MTCRVCHEAVSARDLTCPHCAAPRPALAEFTGEGYEWRSRREWMGAPVLHIAFGLDAEGRARVARGWVAIGQRARGVVAVGLMATGVIAVGLVAVGVLSIGVVAVAAAGALGVNAIAPWAVGVVALGYWVSGLAPLGWRLGT